MPFKRIDKNNDLIDAIVVIMIVIVIIAVAKEYAIADIIFSHLTLKNIIRLIGGLMAIAVGAVIIWAIFNWVSRKIKT